MTKQSVRPYMIAFIVLAVSVGWLWYFWSGVLTEHRQLQNLQVELNQIRQTASLLTYQRDLALEFDLSPAIVIAVDNRSREVVDSSKEEWKYIPNHQFCTFLILSLIHVESGGQMIVGELMGLPDAAAQIGDPQTMMQNMALTQAMGQAGATGPQNGVPATGQPPGMLPAQAAGGTA